MHHGCFCSNHAPSAVKLRHLQQYGYRLSFKFRNLLCRKLQSESTEREKEREREIVALPMPLEFQCMHMGHMGHVEYAYVKLIPD